MAHQPTVHGHHHMTSSGHHLATQAGYEIFEAGGNAIDAGVAAGIALSVVHSDMVQFAGVAPIMIYVAARDEVITISGLGPWPRAATLDHFIEAHDGAIPEGVLRTVVPAAPDAWLLALERFGTLSFGDVAAPAIRLAREGFPMHHVMRDYIMAHESDYARWPQNAAIYLPGGRVPAVGERFVQTDLAATMQFMADEESAARRRSGGSNSRALGLEAAHDAFYRGDIAERIVAVQRDHGGWLDREDLAHYKSALEPAVRTRFHDIDLYACGPWCQGPVFSQTLTLLEGFDLAAMGHNEASYIHHIVEATKLAFADREAYYGDPSHIEVPLDALLALDYTAAQRQRIDQLRAAPGLPSPGLGPLQGTLPPPASGQPAASADTSYVCTVDASGNLFSATPSDVSWEAPIVPGMGISPSTRGSQSWAVRGHASAVGPGKRPRLTPNPAIAIAPGRYAMPFGTPGGDNQTQAMAQVLLNHHVFGMSVQDAIEAPRFMCHSFPNSFEPHAYHPGKVTAEGRIPTAVTDALSDMGHDVERLDDMTYKTAGVCAIVRDVETGLLEGGADPRRMSRAMGR